MNMFNIVKSYSDEIDDQRLWYITTKEGLVISKFYLPKSMDEDFQLFSEKVNKLKPKKKESQQYDK